jgi:phosphorylcholine metabolism protein LicD
MKNTNLIILFCIVTIIIFLLQNIVIRNMIINESKINEHERMIAMNGINNQYYVSFSRHYNMFQLFKVLIKILNDNNIDYCISCGTLLGYYRHNNGFIPWDDDIDICVVEKDLDKLKIIMSEFMKKNNYYFKEVLHLYKFSNSPLHNASFHITPFIDIFIINNNDNKLIYKYNKSMEFLFPNEHYIEDELYPLQNGSFKLYLPDGKICEELLIKLPNKPYKYLDRVYKNWKIKKVYMPHSLYNMFIFNKYIPIDTIKSTSKDKLNKISMR